MSRHRSGRARCPYERLAAGETCLVPGCGHTASRYGRVCKCCLIRAGGRFLADRVSMLRQHDESRITALSLEDEAIAKLVALGPPKWRYVEHPPKGEVLR